MSNESFFCVIASEQRERGNLFICDLSVGYFAHKKIPTSPVAPRDDEVRKLEFGLCPEIFFGDNLLW